MYENTSNINHRIWSSHFQNHWFACDRWQNIYYVIRAGISRSSCLRGKFHEKLVKFNESSFFFKSKNIVSWRITESGIFQTFSGKFEIKAIPVDQFSWIKFRSPILMELSSLPNFRFVDRSTRSQSRGKVFPLKPILKPPGTKKFRGSTLVSLICVPNFISKY